MTSFSVKHFSLRQTIFNAILLSFLLHLFFLSLCSFRFYKKADLQKPSLVFLGSILRQGDFTVPLEAADQFWIFRDLPAISAKSEQFFIPVSDKPLSETTDKKQSFKPIAYTRRPLAVKSTVLDKEFELPAHEPLKLNAQ